MDKIARALNLPPIGILDAGDYTFFEEGVSTLAFFTDEVKRSMSIKARERWTSQEERDLQAARLAGNSNRLGVKFSEESIEKLKAFQSNRTVHGMQGKSHSEESKQLMRERRLARGYGFTDATKQKIKDKRALRNTPEYKQQQSDRMKQIWADRRMSKGA